MSDNSRTAAQIPDAYLPGMVRAVGKVAKGWKTQASAHWPRARRGELDLEALRALIDADLARGDNVAFVPPEGVIVVDCDNEAAAQWMTSIAPFGTPVMRRHDQGGHWYFQFDPAMQISGSRGYEYDTPYGRAKLDLKGNLQGYVIAPPSDHDDGRPYRWDEPLPERLEDLPTLPDELIEMILARGQVNLDRLPGAEGDATRHMKLLRYEGRVVRRSRAYDEALRKCQSFAEDLFAGDPERLKQEMDRLPDRVRQDWDDFGGTNAWGTTDEEVIEQFLATYGDGLAYDTAFKTWRWWDGAHWAPVDQLAIEKEICEFGKVLMHDAMIEFDDREKFEALTTMAQQLKNTRKVKAVFSRLKAQVHFDGSLYDQRPEIVVYRANEAGIGYAVDLTRPEAEPFIATPDLLNTHTLPVTYQGDVADERWNQFVRDTWPDEETRVFVQMAAGASLLGEHKPEVFLFLFGGGGTGKSTFLSALLAAFGAYGVKMNFNSFTGDQTTGSGPSPDIAQLKGRRYVSVSEVPSNVRLGARMKELTGGEVLTGRPLFCPPVEFKSQHTVWVAGNVEPNCDITDQGLRRRIRLIPTDHGVPPERRDVTLKDHLMSDPAAWRAVLLWVLEGVALYRDAGFRLEAREGSEIWQATELYWSAQNPIDDWYRECAAKAPEYIWTPVQDAYRSYMAWHLETYGTGSGEKAISKRRLGDLMKERGHRSEKGTAGVRYLTGVEIEGIPPLNRREGSKAGQNASKQSGASSDGLFGRKSS